MPKENTLQKLKEKERAIRSNIIIDAAERVFATTPFNKVNMRDIAKKAGISPASIYRYFPDQQSLFVQAFVRGIQSKSGLIEKMAKDKNVDSLEQAADRYIDFLIEKDQYFRMMTHFMLDADLNHELVEQINTIGRTLLKEADDLFARMGVKNPRLLSHAFIAALNGILITFHNYPGRTPEEVRRHMLQLGRVIALMFRTGAGSPEVPKLIKSFKMNK